MNECSICLEEINDNNNFILSCNHNFHKVCLVKLIKNRHYKCPLCRKNIKNTKFLYDTNVEHIIDDNMLFIYLLFYGLLLLLY